MTNYVGVHGANYAAIESAINALQTQVAGSLGTLISGGNSSEAMFGIQNALINEGSYLPTADGTDLDIAAGYFWHFASFTVRRKLTASTIAFAGDSAATYYVVIDSTGEPAKSATSTGAAYSVVWTGSAFGTITRLVPIAWGFETFDDAKTLANLGSLVYQTLDGLLEGLAGAATSSIAKTVTSADVTLTTLEAMENIVVVLTGTKTADRNLIVPNFQKPYVIINGTAGAFALTVKTAAGTGVALENGENAVVFCDATNVVEVITGPSGGGAPPPGLPFADSNTIIKGSADATKLMRFEVDGFTSATTRVITPPNRDITLVDRFSELTDGAGALSGNALKDVRVNSGATALEYYAPPYDVASMYNGEPTTLMLMLHHVFARQVIFPAGLTASQGVAGVAATAQTDFDIQKNGSSVGTMRFAAAATSATFIMASQQTFAAGDILKVLAPASPDATLEDITFTLSGVR